MVGGGGGVARQTSLTTLLGITLCLFSHIPRISDLVLNTITQPQFASVYDFNVYNSPLFILPFSSAFIHLFSFSINSLSLVLCLFYVSVCFSSFVVKLHKGCISWMVGATQTKVSWHYYWTKDDERFNTKINDTKQKHTSRDMSHMGCWLIPEITFIWCTNCYSWTGLITIWNLFLTVFLQ